MQADKEHLKHCSMYMQSSVSTQHGMPNKKMLHGYIILSLARDEGGAQIGSSCLTKNEFGKCAKAIETVRAEVTLSSVEARPAVRLQTPASWRPGQCLTTCRAIPCAIKPAPTSPTCTGFSALCHTTSSKVNISGISRERGATATPEMCTSLVRRAGLGEDLP